MRYPSVEDLVYIRHEMPEYSGPTSLPDVYHPWAKTVLGFISQRDSHPTNLSSLLYSMWCSFAAGYGVSFNPYNVYYSLNCRGPTIPPYCLRYRANDGGVYIGLAFCTAVTVWRYYYLNHEASLSHITGTEVITTRYNNCV